MDTQTMDAFNQLLNTMQNVGFGMVLALIVGLMVIAYILDLRNRARQEQSGAKQLEKLVMLLSTAINNQDSETAKAIAPLAELVAMTKTALDQNTQAFVQDRDYRRETLDAMKELALLQSENNKQVAAMRDDFKEWPQTTAGDLEKRLEKYLVQLKQEIVVSILEVPAGSGLANYFRDILSKLDQILKSVISNADLLHTLTTPPAPRVAVVDTLGYELALAEKRKTNELPKVENVEP